MYARSDRLKELFREEIVKILRNVKDPGLSGFLTVTGVDLTPDKKTVIIFYSLIGTDRQRETSAKALERAAPFIRQVLRKKLSLKTIPQIVFTYDETPQKASRIEKLLLDLKRQQEGS